jgi:hypothetical protein
MQIRASARLLPVLALVLLPGATAPADDLRGDGPVEAAAVPVECGSLAGRVRIAALQDYQPTYSTFNYPQDGQGHFDTLMATSVNVAGQGRSCLVAHFSTMAYPLDNAIVFQVRVDGKPMKGHLSSVANVPTPAVFDPEETDLNQPRMVSYTFFEQVSPGIHQVEVLFAGCCSAAPPVGVAAWAGSPVLALHYR